MSDGRLVALLHLCDSLFPTGGYAQSDGLEAATASGAIHDAAGLRTWIDTLVDETLARTEGPAVLRAWEHVVEHDWDALRALDDEVYGQRPSSTAREASRGVGTRLLTTWLRLHSSPGIERLTGARWTLPVAFSAACAVVGTPQRAAVEAFMYTRLSATASSAMRLMPLGQVEAHAMLADAVARVPSLCDRVTLRRERPTAFAPLVDIANMQQQYVTSRLFRS